MIMSLFPDSTPARQDTSWGGAHRVARSRQVCIYWLWKHCLLLSILPGERANTYTHRKMLSVECLTRANSWPLSSCAFPAGPYPAEHTSVRLYECTSVRTCE